MTTSRHKPTLSQPPVSNRGLPRGERGVSAVKGRAAGEASLDGATGAKPLLYRVYVAAHGKVLESVAFERRAAFRLRDEYMARGYQARVAPVQ